MGRDEAARIASSSLFGAGGGVVRGRGWDGLVAGIASVGSHGEGLSCGGG